MAQKAKAPAAENSGRYYPTLEEFLEQEPRSAVEGTFKGAQDKLIQVKGAKAAGAKKAAAAVEKTEALLRHLYDVKERIATEAGSKGRK